MGKWGRCRSSRVLKFIPRRRGISPCTNEDQERRAKRLATVPHVGAFCRGALGDPASSRGINCYHSIECTLPAATPAYSFVPPIARARTSVLSRPSFIGVHLSPP